VRPGPATNRNVPQFVIQGIVNIHNHTMNFTTFSDVIQRTARNETPDRRNLPHLLPTASGRSLVTKSMAWTTSGSGS
jgi:hypothetical protein